MIDRVYHIDRGYEKIEMKLAAVGADIERIRESVTASLPKPAVGMAVSLTHGTFITASIGDSAELFSVAGFSSPGSSCGNLTQTVSFATESESTQLTVA